MSILDKLNQDAVRQSDSLDWWSFDEVETEKMGTVFLGKYRDLEDRYDHCHTVYCILHEVENRDALYAVLIDKPNEPDYGV